MMKRITSMALAIFPVFAAIGSISAPATVLIVGTLGAPAAYAQGYPNRPVKILVHVPPGSAPDIIARVIADKMGPSLGQPVIVENRTGSNGNIAAEIVVRSPPDGNTLLLCADSHIVINPHVYKKMSFDPLTDLVPVASLATNQFFLVTNPAQPFHTVREFVDYAKKANPPLAYASGGNGSQHQLTMEMFKVRAGIDLLHVPFKAAGPATMAIIAGDVPVMFAGSNAGPLIRSGKLRALAVAGPKRLPAFPDVPTVAETYPGFVNSIWLGLCAPRGTPMDVITRLREEVNRVLVLPTTKEIFSKGGALEPFISTPEEFSALIRADYEKYGNIVRSVGVTLD